MNNEPARGWRDVRRVLAVRLDNLGDVLMTTPALAAIRESVPRVHIALLASPAGIALADCLPCIDDVIAFPAPWVKSASGDESTLGRREQRMVETITEQNFDAAVIFTVCTQTALPAALLCRMAGIRQRLAHSRENPYGLLTHWVPETDHVQDGMRHEVARQLALVASVGCRTTDERLRLTPTARHFAAARARLAAAGLDPEAPHIVVHPGATAPSRRYPSDRLGMAAGRVARETGWPVVFVGQADERTSIDEARRHVTDSVVLAGGLSVGEISALIARSVLVLCNNSGPAHIAAAMGTPVVVLYALTNPQHTPWQVPARVLSHWVPCRWCLQSVCPQGHHDCLMRIEPDTVAEAALALIAESAPNSRVVMPEFALVAAGGTRRSAL